MRTPVHERLWAAERGLGWLRIGTASILTLHRVLFGPLPGSQDSILIAALAFAWAYTGWLFLARGSKADPPPAAGWRKRAFATRPFTAIVDAAIITVFVGVTGASTSPWYPLYYVALAMIAFRYAVAEVTAAALAYAAAWLVLAAVDATPGSAPDVAFRVAMLGLLAALVGPLGGETVAQARARLSMHEVARRAEEATAHLRGLLWDAGAGIVVLDPEGSVEFANAQAQRTLGGALEGKRGAELAASFAEPRQVGARLAGAVSNEEPLALAAERRFVRLSVSAYGAWRGRIVVVDDVTAELAENRELRAARFRAEESERRRIARELHDEVGEVLTGLHLALDRMAAGRDLGRSPEELLDTLLQRVQSLTADLRPPVLDDLGLLPAVARLVERFRVQTGIAVELKQTGLGERLDPEVEITAYRVVQEALTNVARHAGAQRVAVRAWLSGNVLGLQIEDDGRGMASYNGSGSGLTGMRERVGLLGGTFDVDAAPGAGTRVSVEIPVGLPGR